MSKEKENDDFHEFNKAIEQCMEGRYVKIMMRTGKSVMNALIIQAVDMRNYKVKEGDAE